MFRTNAPTARNFQRKDRVIKTQRDRSFKAGWDPNNKPGSYTQMQHKEHQVYIKVFLTEALAVATQVNPHPFLATTSPPNTPYLILCESSL